MLATEGARDGCTDAGASDWEMYSADECVSGEIYHVLDQVILLLKAK